MIVRFVLSTLAVSATLALPAHAQETTEAGPSFEVTNESLVAAYVPEDVKSDTFYLASASSLPASTASPAPVAAEDMAIAKQGIIEFSLAGSGTNDRDFDVGSASVAANIGYFIIDNLQLSARQNVFFADGGGDSSWNGITRGAIDFHIPFGEVVPFIGANIGYLYGESVEETFVAAPEIGVKWYLRDDAFLMALIEYEFYFKNTDDADDAFEDGQFIYALGIGLAF